MGSLENSPLVSAGEAGSAAVTMAENPAVMADHFEKIQKLADPIPGCPNFRRVPGYKVYCCGQPTAEGFEKALEKVTASYHKDGKIIWFNLRQEPTVYVNGEPLCARPPNKIGEYAELGNVTRDSIKEQEVSFIKTCKERAEANGGKLKYVDINKNAKEIEVKSIKTLSATIEGLRRSTPALFTGEFPSATPELPWRLTSTSWSAPWSEPPSTPPSSSTTRSASPGPPPAASPPASTRSSRSPPPSRVSSRLCPAWTCPSSRWTDTRWTPTKTLSSEESSRSSKSSLLSSVLTVRPPRGNATRSSTRTVPPRPEVLASSSSGRTSPSPSSATRSWTTLLRCSSSPRSWTTSTSTSISSSSPPT